MTNSTLKQAYRSLHQGERKRVRLSRETQRRVEQYVQQKRADGASWRDVGDALGMSRQSAWERFHHLPAIPAQRSQASRTPRAPSGQPARQQAERVERYVQLARAAGASWRTIGKALGIKGQSAWKRFQHLPASSSQTTSPRPYSRDEEKVLGMRAEGATWRAVGKALGITRQSAWERFRHLSPPETPDIPEEVLRARDITPHAFARWVVEAATKDPQIERWLHTPNRDLGLSTGHHGAMTPSDLLRTDGLRTFLITMEINRRTPVTTHRLPARASRRRR